MTKLILEIFGDFHPLMVHFPIGLFGLIAISLLFSKLRKLELPMNYFRLVNYLCLASLMLAIALGIASENSRSFYGNDAILLERHELLGFVTLAFFSLACFFLYRSNQKHIYYNWYVVFFVISFAFLTIGGHFGSIIVHGEVKLIKLFSPEPDKIPIKTPVKDIIDQEALPETKVSKIDFGSQIKPILEENCFKCHGEKKQKGDLRLDTNDFKEVIEPFKPEKSKLFELISLPADHEDIMPPEDGPLSKEKINLIENWIKQGAEATPLLNENK